MRADKLYFLYAYKTKHGINNEEFVQTTVSVLALYDSNVR